MRLLSNLGNKVNYIVVIWRNPCLLINRVLAIRRTYSQIFVLGELPHARNMHLQFFNLKAIQKGVSKLIMLVAPITSTSHILDYLERQLLFNFPLKPNHHGVVISLLTNIFICPLIVLRPILINRIKMNLHILNCHVWIVVVG